MEIGQALNAMSLNGGTCHYFLYVSTALNSKINGAPILDSDVSTTFVTSDDYLINTRKHKTKIATDNEKRSSQLSGK